MKTWIKGLAAVSGTLAMGRIILKRASKRSVKSQVAEWLVSAQNNEVNYEDYDSKCDFVNQLFEVNAEEYQLPTGFRAKSNVQEFHIGHTQVFKYQGLENSRIGILYIHGAAYIHQPNLFHHRFVDDIAHELNVNVEMPIYPKAPNDIFVSAYESLIDVYKYMIEQYDDVIMIGDSAGGGLSAGLIQLINKQNIKQPLHAFLISPWIEMTMENESIDASLQQNDPLLTVEGLKFAGDLWCGHTSKDHYLLSPINGNLEGMPPMTIFVGTREILLPDIRSFKDKLQQLNSKVEYHEFMNQNHNFPLYPIPEANEAKHIMYQTIHRICK
ncbi:alpha/beta hydrolase fold domain-containing protein [Mammaliicoccus sp. Dog046]|uniref:alpha/beta hydrolase fold domain-containing protein n=1 Tax=Mammaliicoccus sp. Dog046 TaxID=3034233 RepID=UPI002B2602A9|nr:alpha/beta hydrolase fold domain-containing protein [Mammaliicoccus sp. Dog046]WQK84533.1 alpha/beta hydrolase fold domain-containing protein [Mammaliicoccus sp. Dog046]